MMHAWVQVRHQQPIACVIHNLSEEGALVEFLGLAPAVNRLTLIIDYEDFAVDCDVRRRRAQVLSLQFRESSKVELASSQQTGRELVRKRRALLHHPRG